MWSTICAAVIVFVSKQIRQSGSFMSCIRRAIRHRCVWYLDSIWLRCCSRFRCLDGLIRGMLLGCNDYIGVLRFYVDMLRPDFIGLMALCNIITKINITFIIIIIISISVSLFICIIKSVSVAGYSVTLLHSFVVLALSVYRDLVAIFEIAPNKPNLTLFYQITTLSVKEKHPKKYTHSIH